VRERTGSNRNISIHSASCSLQTPHPQPGLATDGEDFTTAATQLSAPIRLFTDEYARRNVRGAVFWFLAQRTAARDQCRWLANARGIRNTAIVADKPIKTGQSFIQLVQWRKHSGSDGLVLVFSFSFETVLSERALKPHLAGSRGRVARSHKNLLHCPLSLCKMIVRGLEGLAASPYWIGQRLAEDTGLS
jgi:hypothetical protein